MTVEELIKQLKQYPSNEEVIFMDLSSEEIHVKGFMKKMVA